MDMCPDKGGSCRARAVRGLGLVGITLLAAACVGPRTHDRTPAGSATDGAEFNSPLVPGGVGLEAHRWLVRANLAERAGALRTYESISVPMSAQQVERWRACGLRVLTVPIEELAGVRSALRVAPSPERVWLGTPSRWSDLQEGPRSERARTLATDAGPLTIESGSVRLLVRAWARPARVGDDETPAVLRVELLPQAAARSRPSLLDPPSMPRDMSAGLTMPRLAAAIESERDVAILIIPEHAGVDWSGEDEGPMSDTAGSLGPPLPEWPTLGDALFGAWEDARTGREERLAMVLILRVPARYQLLASP